MESDSRPRYSDFDYFQSPERNGASPGAVSAAKVVGHGAAAVP